MRTFCRQAAIQLERSAVRVAMSACTAAAAAAASVAVAEAFSASAAAAAAASRWACICRSTLHGHPGQSTLSGLCGHINLKFIMKL